MQTSLTDQRLPARSKRQRTPQRWKNAYRNLSSTNPPFKFSIFKAWLAAQIWRCQYCEEALDNSDFTLDHEVPISLGGSSRIENLRLACKNCNLSKGTLTGAEFSEILRAICYWKPERQAALLRRLRQGWRYFR